MKSRKILTALMAVTLAASMTACADNGDSEKNSDTNSKTTTATTTATKETSADVTTTTTVAPVETVITTTKTETPPLDISFSDNILLSINDPGEGFGSDAERANATIMIYTDGSIRVFMNIEGHPEIASFKMTEDEYKELSEIANPEEINNYVVEEDWEVLDGYYTYITLYDKNDEVAVEKGGYMPKEGPFLDTYRAIKDILEPYGIPEIADDYRHSLDENQ